MSNLLKSGYVNMIPNNVRVIDYNQTVEEKIHTIYQEAGTVAAEFATQNAVEALFAAQNAGTSHEDGTFTEGLHAETVSLNTYDGPSAEEIAKEAREEAQAIISQAQAEAEQIRRSAQAEGRQQGYEDGRQQGEREIAAMQEEFLAKQHAWEEQYEKQLEQIEPMMVETLMGIYRHIFQFDVPHYGGIVTYLLERAIRNIEGSREFLVHVAKADYAAVSAHKQQLMNAVSRNQVTFEVIEDLTLRTGECLIETEGGIFDCGIGTQLSELERELQILSYKK